MRERASSLEKILHHNEEFVLGMTGTIDLYYYRDRDDQLFVTEVTEEIGLCSRNEVCVGGRLEF